MPNNPIEIASYRCGRDCPLLLIAGPCVLQEEYLFPIAEHLAKIREEFPVQIVFKGSFDKANRSSIESYRGPGLQAGLSMLAEVRKRFGFPVTTDIHESHQAAAVAEVCELIQVPAFLARQTDLLVAAANTGRAVHVKKGQFMAPEEMKNVVDKLEQAGCRNILLGERGTFFGYGRLVNDMQSLVVMRNFGVPVVFDATHSVQRPAGLGKATGGNREMIEPLACAAMAVGIDALFLETHPDPEKSPSDGPNMVPLDRLFPLLARLLKIREARQCPLDQCSGAGPR